MGRLPLMLPDDAQCAQCAFWSQVIDALDHPFLVIDAKTHTILLANTRARDRGIAEGMTCFSASHALPMPCLHTSLSCPLEMVKASRKSVTVEHKHIGPDGAGTYYELHAHPVFDEQGNVAQMIEFAFDISERRRLVEELENAHSALEKRVGERTADLQASRALHQVLERAQSLFIEGSTPFEDLAGDMLDDLLRLTGHSAGIIVAAAIDTQDAPFPLRTIAAREAGLSESQTVAGGLIEDLHRLAGQGLLASQGTAGRPKSIAEEHHAIVLPVLRGDRVLGMFGLAGSPSPSRIDRVEEFLAPFLAGCALLIDAHHARMQGRADKETISRLAAFPQESPNPVLSLDADGRPEYVNPVAHAFMERNDLTIDEFLPRGHREAARTAIGENTAICLENNVAGSAFLWTLSPVQGTKLVHVYGRDITDRRHFENSLQDTRERLSMALVGGDLGTWDWDLVTNEIVFNERWAEMLDYRPDEIESNLATWERLVHPDDKEATWREIQAHISGKTPLFHFEFRMHKADGSYCWILSRGKVMRHNAHGRPLRMCGTHMDVTDRVKALELLHTEQANLEETVALRTTQLRASLLELEEANRQKNRFLASMSHEFRTPLNSILGFNDLLREQFFGPLNEKQKEYVEHIGRSGKHLLALINDLLDIAKIDACRMELSWQTFPHEELLDASASMMQTDFVNKGIECVVVPPDTEIILLGDQRRCRQIMLNLLSNAVKFTQKGGTVTMGIEREENGMARVYVADTGMGIEPDKLDRIFSEFYQAERVRDEEMGGTGIGLALTRRLVELHGGEIGVTSEPGRGSTFWFTLRTGSQSSLAPAEPDSTDRHHPGTTRPGAKILVVEDNRVNRMVLLDMLKPLDLEIAVAENGAEAVETARSFLPDLVFMDVHMPVMDGIEATRRLRALPECVNIPIIALTANADEASVGECISAGCTAHLAKPVQSAVLHRALDTHLDAPRNPKQQDIPETGSHSARADGD